MTYTWHFGDGTSSSGTVSGGQAPATKMYNVDGTYQAYLEVSDGNQTTFSQLVEINVGVVNLPPVINSFTSDVNSGLAPLTVNFTASVTDPESDPLTYEVVYGDGQTSGVQSVPGSGMIVDSHEYASDGNYNAILFISDTVNNVQSDPRIIIVGVNDLPPVVDGLVTLLESDIKVSFSTGTTVAAWLDGSGFGNNLTASGDPQWVATGTPTGHPSIVFDGVGDILVRNESQAFINLPEGTDERSVFLVANYINTQGVSSGVAFGDAVDNKAFGLVADGTTGDLAVQGIGTNNDFVSTTAGVGAGWLVQSVTYGNDAFTHYVDVNTSIDSQAHQFNTDLSAPTSQLVVGSGIGGTGFSQIEVGAVLIYDRELTTLERDQVEAYLVDKYIVGNGVPIANDDTYGTVTGGTIDTNPSLLPTVLDNDSDPNMDPLTAVLVNDVSNGTLLLDPSGSFLYIHDGGIATVDTFTYEAFDGTNSSVPATVTINIGSPSAPLATGDSYTVLDAGTLDTAANSLLSVLFNDNDGVPGDGNDIELDATLVTPPTNGNLTLDSSGHFVYTHNGSATTTDSFTYTANHVGGSSAATTVNIDIVDGSNLNVVRWHGDYYQYHWEAGIPGGAPSSVRENRWLRGGPNNGAQLSTQDLDLDNDGNFDDSRVYFEFSLTNPLNPLTTTPKVNGHVYHADLPSAQFYGGLSAEYLNYETDRIQQAFIENDGAGGEVGDVGYISPYLGPAHQGFRDFIETARHADGRPKKTHVGVQEDFAINIYRPDLPHPLDPQDDPSDNLVSFAAAFVWDKADFLNGADSNLVSLDSNSIFSFESTRWWYSIGEARWIIKDANDSLYISQFSVAGSQDNWGAKNEFTDPLSSLWALYQPTLDNLEFNAGAATFIDPATSGLFSDIQAFGIHIAQTTPTGNLTKFSLDEIRFDAVVTASAPSASINFDAVVTASAPPSSNNTDREFDLSPIKYFKGTIDEVKIFEGTLVEHEVKNKMNFICFNV